VVIFPSFLLKGTGFELKRRSAARSAMVWQAAGDSDEVVTRTCFGREEAQQTDQTT